MTSMLERLRDTANSHDAERMASLFAENYRSVSPVHPDRGYVGRAQVLANWSSVFDGVPAFSSELIASTVDGETEWGEWGEWGEWAWQGHHTDGSSFAMRGMMILTVRAGLVAEARLYLEPVDAAGGDIAAAVEQLYKPGTRDR